MVKTISCWSFLVTFIDPALRLTVRLSETDWLNVDEICIILCATYFFISYTKCVLKTSWWYWRSNALSVRSLTTARGMSERDCETGHSLSMCSFVSYPAPLRSRSLGCCRWWLPSLISKLCNSGNILATVNVIIS